MTCLSVRNRSRLVCAAGTLLGLTLLAGLNASQAQARPSTAQAAISVTSVSAPTQFNSGDNISLEVGLSGSSAQVHVTSVPAGVVDYTATVTSGSPFSVPTSASVPGADEGETVTITLKVSVGQQSLQTSADVTATRGELEPIFPRAAAASTAGSENEDGDLEPIFPRAGHQEGEDGELEPIFPKATTSAATPGELEPIFPKASTPGELEPIFPRATAKASTPGELEPIFPKATTPGELEPIFPKTAKPGELEPIFPRAAAYSILEPIFPRFGVARYGELEPIFPKPTASVYTASTTPGELEPIFPKTAKPGELEPIFPKP